MLGLVFALLLTGGITAFVLRTISADKESTVGPSKQLARAIVANDPSAAPDDTEDYVKGVRGYFGRVRSARFLGTHTVRVGSGNQATTHLVSETLLRTRRGAAVLELEFRREGGPFSKEHTISGIEEVEPDKVRSDLGSKSEAALERGFRRRGRRVAGSLDLDGSFTGSGRQGTRGRPVPAPTPPDPETVARNRQRSLEKLRCIQRANQDVEKIKKC